MWSYKIHLKIFQAFHIYSDCILYNRMLPFCYSCFLFVHLHPIFHFLSPWNLYKGRFLHICTCKCVLLVILYNMIWKITSTFTTHFHPVALLFLMEPPHDISFDQSRLFFFFFAFARPSYPKVEWTATLPTGMCVLCKAYNLYLIGLYSEFCLISFNVSTWRSASVFVLNT